MDIISLLRVESMIVELNKDGDIIRVLRDVSKPLEIESVSEVLDRGRSLYLGSFQAPYKGICTYDTYMTENPVQAQSY